MNPSLKRQLLRTFSQMLTDFKDQKDIELFLNDFFSSSELEEIIKRISIAYWLKKHRSHQNIKENLKASLDEIQIGEKLLKKEGVKLAIKQIEAEEWANVWVEKITTLRLRR